MASKAEVKRYYVLEPFQYYDRFYNRGDEFIINTISASKRLSKTKDVLKAKGYKAEQLNAMEPYPLRCLSELPDPVIVDGRADVEGPKEIKASDVVDDEGIKEPEKPTNILT